MADDEQQHWPKKPVIGYRSLRSHKKGCQPLPLRVYTDKEKAELAKTLDLTIHKKRKRIVIP